LALTWLTCGGRSVGIVRLRTKGHGVLDRTLNLRVFKDHVMKTYWEAEVWFHGVLTSALD
jgi:hypothetical protein